MGAGVPNVSVGTPGGGYGIGWFRFGRTRSSKLGRSDDGMHSQWILVLISPGDNEHAQQWGISTMD